MTNSGAKKYNYAHCRRPFYVQENGQYAQGPGQPAAPPPNQAPMPPPQYPQYPQQPYPPQYQPPPTQPPMPPPKKSNAGLVIGVMLVVVILIVVLLAYLFVLAPGDDNGGKSHSVTYEEFLDDIDFDLESMAVTFDSFDDGDVVDITGTVAKVKLADVPSGVVGVDSGAWTIVYFEPPSGSSMTIYDSFAYKGDISDEYTVGQEGTVTVHIVEMSLMGITAEYPEEYMTADMVDNYVVVPTASMDFTETSPGNFTGGVVSASAEIHLNEIEIEIYDSSSGYSGTDDGDLTDDSPEEVEVWYGNLALEFTDANDNNKLDAGDVFTLTNAEPGDEITIFDTYSYEEIAYYVVI